MEGRDGVFDDYSGPNPNELIKNEHMVWAWGEQQDGGKILIVGLTDIGFEFLRTKKTLLLNPPFPLPIINNVILFHEPTKAEVKERMKEAQFIADTQGLDKI